MLMARRLRVRGRVQGVGFRHFVAQTARSEGAAGWVRNCPDGSVEAFIEGTADVLDRLEHAIRKGPTLSRVDAVDVRGEPATGVAHGFRIDT